MSKACLPLDTGNRTQMMALVRSVPGHQVRQPLRRPDLQPGAGRRAQGDGGHRAGDGGRAQEARRSTSRRYARVEKIPGGYLEDSKVLDGVMLNKDVVHPAMKRQDREPAHHPAGLQPRVQAQAESPQTTAALLKPEEDFALTVLLASSTLLCHRARVQQPGPTRRLRVRPREREEGASATWRAHLLHGGGASRRCCQAPHQDSSNNLHLRRETGAVSCTCAAHYLQGGRTSARGASCSKSARNATSQASHRYALHRAHVICFRAGGGQGGSTVRHCGAFEVLPPDELLQLPGRLQGRQGLHGAAARRLARTC